MILILWSSLVFGESVTISGAIQAPNGKPVKKAAISLYSLKNDLVAESATNRKGKFELKDIEPAFYFLTVQHESFATKRLKINPRKTRNIDLILRLTLSEQEEPVLSYLFDNVNPTEHDPILSVKNVKVKSLPEKVIITWDDIKQAESFTVFENNIEIYGGSNNRLEHSVSPGTDYCYTIQAYGQFGLYGTVSEPLCVSASTLAPRDIVASASKNTLLLDWSPVEGAVSYVVYRNEENIGNTSGTSFTDPDLEFGTDYFYTISAFDARYNESPKSVEVKGRTRDLVEPPILSSITDDDKIKLIWNEVDAAKSYKVYRGGILVSQVESNNFTDSVNPGIQYCYEITSVDQFNVESELSNTHCTKIILKAPRGVTADGDVQKMHLNWQSVEGAVYYQVYEKLSSDSMEFVGKTKQNQFTVENLSYGIDKCFYIKAVDSDDDKSDISNEACNVVKTGPDIVIQKMTLIEPSGNGILDASEIGELEFAVFNQGQSPAHQVKFFLESESADPMVQIIPPNPIDTLEAGKIEFVTFQLEGLLKIPSSEHEYDLHMTCKESIALETPYPVLIESKAVTPPIMIVADFAVSNDFGTQYIPKGEPVTLTIRVQNVGEGVTETLRVDVPENRTFSTPDFESVFETGALYPGDFIDLEIPIQSTKSHFTLDVHMTDYIDHTHTHRINLELMKHYRPPTELIYRDIGEDSIIHYPSELGEIDVDSKIPFGRKNPNIMGIIFATESYDDPKYSDIDYALRDGQVVRHYFKNAFGMGDFQLLPSKTWQMEGGPTLNDFHSTFDPHQGDLRKRIVTAEKYSDIDEMDLILYYRGYGEWVNGRPLLIPKDARSDRDITKYALDELLNNLSRLSVIDNIKTITLFLDISFLNPKASSGTSWDFPEISDKICILNASSFGETSNIFPEKKHSIFTYSLLKGLGGAADDGDQVIELGELTEFIYKEVPDNARKISASKGQNPSFIGMDLKRMILDLR